MRRLSQLEPLWTVISTLSWMPNFNHRSISLSAFLVICQQEHPIPQRRLTSTASAMPESARVKSSFSLRKSRCASPARLFTSWRCAYLRDSLATRLIGLGNVYFCRVESDAPVVVKQGDAYRATYVESITCTGFTETRHRPTGAPRKQYDAIWMSLTVTDYYEPIPDPTIVGAENATLAKTLTAQVQQLAAAVAEHEAAGHHVVGTFSPGDLERIEAPDAGETLRIMRERFALRKMEREEGRELPILLPEPEDGPLFEELLE